MAVTKKGHVAKKIKNKEIFRKKKGKFGHKGKIADSKATKSFKKIQKNPSNKDATESKSEKKPKPVKGKKLITKPRRGTLKRRINFRKKQETGMTPGVIYLGHIPHGFFEKEMKKYFSQFGRVTRLRLARSRKTGNMKGFAFIEFACDEVAKIVAETMNNYLMFDKLLQCEFIPPENVHPETFKNGANFTSAQMRAFRLKANYNKDKTEEALAKASRRRKLKLNKTKKKLAEQGIDFNFEIPTDFVRSSKTKEEKASKEVAVTPSKPKKVKKLSSAETSISPERTFISNNDSVASDVLVVDLNDSEITLKTPPTAKKVYKKRTK